MSKIDVNELAARSGSNISMTAGHTIKPNLHSQTVFPTGHVLQTLHSESTSEVSSTSTSYADTGFNLSITPSSTGSKVLIYFEFGNYFFGSNASAELGSAYKLVRDSTDIKAFEDANGYTLKDERSASNYWNVVRVGLTHFDSPSTTSAVNYKLQFARKIGGTLTIKGVTKIILQEIAG